MHIRSPIVSVLGHVDHGKTTILDAIRGSYVAQKEVGGITQMIGASYIPSEHISRVSSEIMKRMNIRLKIPGILLIDTPGHEAFTTLRERGGSIADISILVVDITQGVQVQTVESIKILKHHKTPFLIAANKIDLIPGWIRSKTMSFSVSFSNQPDHVKEALDAKIYDLIGAISMYGFDSERFDRIFDFTKNVAIVPVSGKTKEGIAELLLLVAGLSQRFLGGRLNIHEDMPGKGSILEVKEAKGMGTVIDVILYDGVMRKGDKIAFLKEDGICETNIRALLEPSFKNKNTYANLDEIYAAAGIRIFAPNLGGAIPGSPITVVSGKQGELENIRKQYAIITNVADIGVVVCTDSLGSAEAISSILKDNNIPIRYIHVGKVRKKDVLEAEVVKNADPFLGVLLVFNVIIPRDVLSISNDKSIPIIYSNVIYEIIDKYNEWKETAKKEERTRLIKSMPLPSIVRVLEGCVFRMSRPAVFGVKVLAGTLRPGVKLMNTNANIIGEVKSMQKNKVHVDKAIEGEEVAIALEGGVCKQDFDERDVLYTYMTKNEVMAWANHMSYLTDSEKNALKEIREIVIKPII